MTERPAGIVLLSAFFAFGAGMAMLAAVTLLFPGSPLEPVWSLNPTGHDALQSWGGWGISLMGAVAVACALASAGLWRGHPWGRVLAIALLGVNLVGDVVNAVRGDWRTLIGLPVAGAMIAYLVRRPRE